MKAFLYALLPSFSAPTIITTNIFFAWVSPPDLFHVVNCLGPWSGSHSSVNFSYSKLSSFLCILPGQLLPLQRCAIVYSTTVTMRDTSIAIRFFFFIIMKNDVGCREFCRSLMTESTYMYLFFFFILIYTAKQVPENTTVK